MIIHNPNSNSYNPGSFTASHTSASSSVILFGKEDESRFMKDLEDKSRLERIKQVRHQEKEASRLAIQKQQEKLLLLNQKEEEDRKYQDYLKKKQEIEDLKQLRLVEIERAGKAMRDAQEREEKRLREELEKKEKAIRDSKSAKQRGNNALQKERQLMDEKKELEEQIKQIERKKLVQQQESELAHQQASQFRQQESMKSKMSNPNQSQMEKVSKYANKVENSIISKASAQLDYTNTRFHTTLIVRHDHDQVIAEEIEKAKGAYDLAKEEATKKHIKAAQKENTNQVNNQRAKSRGRDALNQEISKKDKRVFEKEMKKVQVKEGLEKIKVGMKNKDVKYIYNEQKDKQKKDKLQNMFEQEFLNPKTKNKNIQPINVPKPSNFNSNTDTLQTNSLSQTIFEQDKPTYQQEKIAVTCPQVQYTYDNSNFNTFAQKPVIGQAEPRQMMINITQGPTEIEVKARQNPPQVESTPQSLKQVSEQESFSSSHHSLSQKSHSSSEYNKFFVPPPQYPPQLAQPGNALPQHNPFLEEIKRKEEEQIKLHLNHPKQPSYVDQFLQENEQYIGKPKHDVSETDSEVPSDSEEDYGNEDDHSSCSSEQTSSYQTSSHASSSMQESESNTYRQENNVSPINKVTKNNEVQSKQVFSYLEKSPDMSDKYFDQHSNFDHSQMNDSIQTSNLADEFLQASANKNRNAQPQYYSSSSSDMSESSLSIQQLSYLKSSANTQNQKSSMQSSQLQQDKKVFDYGTANPLKYTSGIKTGGMDITTPQSELSYSYSEMLNEFDGSNYGSSKMRLSGASYLKSQQQQAPTTMTMQSNFNTFHNNDTIEEESNEEKLSSSHISHNSSSYSLPRNQNLQTNGYNKTNSSGGVRIDTTQENGSGSLADMFRQKKQQLLQSRQEEERPQAKEQKREKTKEELAEIRKQMMRPKTSCKPSLESSQSCLNSGVSSKDDPKSELMSRLARGQKTEVNKKDMLKLTTKNYELLPEVKKKKEEEKKKQERLGRMKQAKDLDRQRRELMNSRR